MDSSCPYGTRYKSPRGNGDPGPQPEIKIRRLTAEEIALWTKRIARQLAHNVESDEDRTEILGGVQRLLDCGNY